MKQRIKVDSVFLASVIIFTLALSFFPAVYFTNAWVDDVLNFTGVLMILKGVLYRMVARGHKRTQSPDGWGLAQSGVYQYVRNPMYLGSFLLGVGFVMILWPWWGVLIFAWIFYSRFIRQIKFEEKHLSDAFGDKYAQYCQRVPRLFPHWRDMEKIKSRGVFNLTEALSTKERWTWAWLLAAFGMELLQGQVVFGSVDIGRTMLVFGAAVVVFFAAFIIQYQFLSKNG